MNRMEDAASAALAGQVIRPIFFCYLDILGDPLRTNTAHRVLQLSGTGDPDLDGHVFDGLDPTFCNIGDVRQKSGGSDSVTATLSGINNLDNALLNVIGDKANWQGRTGRLWRVIRDEFGQQQGAIQHYYTGWMTALTIEADPDAGQMIQLTLESYLSAYSAPSNRTYLDQEAFDPGDLSARATIAIANGMSGNPLVSNTGTGGGVSDGYSDKGILDRIGF